MVIRASTDMRAWITSDPPQLACPDLVSDPRLVELKLVMKVTWSASWALVAGW